MPIVTRHWEGQLDVMNQKHDLFYSSVMFLISLNERVSWLLLYLFVQHVVFLSCFAFSCFNARASNTGRMLSFSFEKVKC